MSYILSVYSKQAFKECLLPAINNADYELCIQKELFGLKKEQEIPMEIIDGKWRFQETKDMRPSCRPGYPLLQEAKQLCVASILRESLTQW